jgi:outer membrane protein assembly factor BamA
MKQISFVVDINDEDDISKITITGNQEITREDVATCMRLLYLDIMDDVSNDDFRLEPFEKVVICR